MTEKLKLLIVNNGTQKVNKLDVVMGKSCADIHVVGVCESISQAEGALHVYEPDIIAVSVGSASSGLNFAEKLARDGFGGILLFCGDCVELDVVCSAMPRGGCVVLDGEDEARTIAKIKAAISDLLQIKKMRRAVDSIFLGAPQITEEYFSRLLAGEDSEYLRLQLGVIDIVLPSSGCVVYGKTLNPLRLDHAERCFTELESALKCKVIGESVRDCFILVADSCDMYEIKHTVKPIVNELGAAGGEFVVGISEFSTDKRSLKDAVKTAQSLVKNNVFLSACGVYTDDDNIVINSNKCRKLVNDAVKLISEHYSEKISAEWAAKQLFVSSSHLMHEFKKSLGSTFNDCLKKYRILRAKELLSSGNYRVNEVARAVGFSDARYFGMVFKEETGISPGEFIKAKGES